MINYMKPCYAHSLIIKECLNVILLTLGLCLLTNANVIVNGK